MELSKALDEKKYDVRVVDRFIGEGKISKAELDKYLHALSDSEGEAVFTPIEALTSNAPQIVN